MMMELARIDLGISSRPTHNAAVRELRFPLVLLHSHESLSNTIYTLIIAKICQSERNHNRTLHQPFGNFISNVIPSGEPVTRFTFWYISVLLRSLSNVRQSTRLEGLVLITL